MDIIEAKLMMMIMMMKVMMMMITMMRMMVISVISVKFSSFVFVNSTWSQSYSTYWVSVEQ